MEGVAERIRARSADLTAAERRVAEVVVGAPERVVFATVAELAATARVGAATVVRLATKLGYDGYSGLQAAVQVELLDQLRPAAERIREQERGGSVERHTAVTLANVRATLAGVDPQALAALADRVADPTIPVALLSGDASVGIATHTAGQLQLLRDSIEVLDGNDVSVRRRIATMPADTTLMVVDLRRYDRWLLDALASARARGWWIASFTDSVLSPLAADADVTFVLTVGSVGPFDGHVGTLALFELVVAEAAHRLRGTATARLDAVEQTWSDAGALTDS